MNNDFLMFYLVIIITVRVVDTFEDENIRILKGSKTVGSRLEKENNKIF
jgi:hypothetical protein